MGIDEEGGSGGANEGEAVGTESVLKVEDDTNTLSLEVGIGELQQVLFLTVCPFSS